MPMPATAEPTPQVYRFKVLNDDEESCGEEESKELAPPGISFDELRQLREDA